MTTAELDLTMFSELLAFSFLEDKHLHGKIFMNPVLKNRNPQSTANHIAPRLGRRLLQGQ